MNIEELVEHLQDVATDANFHEFVRVYADIAEMVTRHAGKQAALKVMQELYDREENREGWIDG